VRDGQPKREERGKGGAGIDRHGFDAGKLIKGKKRHLLVDTLGFVLHALVTAADIQDRDGGVLLLSTLFGQFPFLRKLFADGAYAGPIFRDGAANVMHSMVVEIVKRTDQVKGFVVEPKRWIVERSIAWLNRCRRLAKDWENRNHNALAFLHLASIRLMIRRLCNPS
jgi:transposase